VLDYEEAAAPRWGIASRARPKRSEAPAPKESALRKGQIDFRLLEALQALAAERQVTRAAARLGISQPKLSHILRRLRKATNDPLLVRAGKGMVLTQVAEELAGLSSDFLNRWSALTSQGAPFDYKTARTTFKVQTSDFIMHTLIIPVARTVRQLAPNVSIITTLPPNLLSDQSFALGDTDLAIGYISEIAPEMYISQIMEFDHVYMAAKGHPRIGDTLELSDIAREGHVGMIFGNQQNGKSVTDQRVDDVLAQRGVRRNIVISMSASELVPVLVAETDLIAITARPLAEQAATRIAVKCLEVPVEIPRQVISMAWHARTHKDPAHVWFRNLVRNAALAPARSTP
jgi:DNA-binding transcriptional LysR family regulator